MAAPPGGSLAALDGWVDTVCGKPRADWQVVTIGPGLDYEDPTDIGSEYNGQSVVFELHWRDSTEPYDVLRVKDVRCAVVEGVKGAGGELPWVLNVNMTKATSETTPWRNRGLLVRDVRVGGDVDQNGVGTRGPLECFGVPNDGRFFVLQRTTGKQCRSHVAITAPDAYQLYVPG